MPLMRHELPTTNLRAVRNARAHGLGNDAHRYALQPRQNVALEIHPIERAIIAPRDDSFALLRGGSGTAALSFGRRAGDSIGGYACIAASFAILAALKAGVARLSTSLRRFRKALIAK